MNRNVEKGILIFLVVLVLLVILIFGYNWSQTGTFSVINLPVFTTSNNLGNQKDTVNAWRYGSGYYYPPKTSIPSMFRGVIKNVTKVGDGYEVSLSSSNVLFGDQIKVKLITSGKKTDNTTLVLEKVDSKGVYLNDSFLGYFSDNSESLKTIVLKQGNFVIAMFRIEFLSEKGNYGLKKDSNGMLIVDRIFYREQN